MRVLLISANRFTDPYPVFPLGVEHVAGAIAPLHEVRVLDLIAAGDNEGVGEAIRDFAPDLVGLSLRNIDNTDVTAVAGFVDEYRRVAQAVRAATEAPLVLGGAGFTIFPSPLMRELGADFGVVGEGERLSGLLEALKAGLDPLAAPGVVGPHCPAEVELPTPWEGAMARGSSASAAILAHYLENGAILNLQSSRGCPFRCIYCTYPGIEGHEPRRLAPEDVGRTALRRQESGAKFLFITDSVFNADADHSLAVAAAFEACGVSIPWAAYFSPLAVPDRYYGRLAAAGLTHVEFGTEALCDVTLEAYRKPFSVDQVVASHRAAVEAGLHVAHFYVLGGPGETEQTLQETLDRAEQLERCVHFFFCGMRIYPGTGLHRVALEEGQVDPGDDLLEPTYYLSPALEGVDVEQLVTAHAGRRMNWIAGAGGDRLAKLQRMMYRKGHTGPLWEMLIR